MVVVADAQFAGESSRAGDRHIVGGAGDPVAPIALVGEEFDPLRVEAEDGGDQFRRRFVDVERAAAPERAAVLPVRLGLVEQRRRP